MQCHYCKQEIETGDRFCFHCGKEQPRTEIPPENAGRYCPGCGVPVVPGQAFCMACGTRLGLQAAQADNIRPIPGQAASTPSATNNPSASAALKGAGVARRFLAMFLDGVILSILMGGIIGITGKDLTYWTESLQYGQAFGIEYWTDTMVNSDIFIFSFLIALGYHTFFEGVLGWTPGKLLTGVRVVQKDGAPCGIGRALLRNILRVIDGLGLYLVAALLVWMTPINQRLGDLAAGTLVVRKGDLKN